MSKIVGNIKIIMKIFFYIVIPVLMILGRVLDEILFSLIKYDSHMWFILPLIAGIIMAVVLVRFFHKGFGYIAGFAIIFTLLVLCFCFLKERYPLGSFATHSRERQEELNRAKEIEAPFVESLRALYENDTLAYRQAEDSVRLILKNHGKKAANFYIRQRAIELKQDRDFTDSTEIIIKSINKKQVQTKDQATHLGDEQIGNLETIILEKNYVQGSRLSFKQGDLYTVVSLSGDVTTLTLSGKRQELIVGHTYRVHINKIKSGPIFFHSENGGKIVIEKQ